MPGYVTPFQTSLFRAPGVQLMQVLAQDGIATANLCQNFQLYHHLEMVFSVMKGPQVQQVRVKILQIPTQNLSPKQQRVTKRSKPSEKDVSSSTVSRWRPQKFGYAAIWSAKSNASNVEQI